jgi:hypothetical protein
VAELVRRDAPAHAGLGGESAELAPGHRSEAKAARGSGQR